MARNFSASRINLSPGAIANANYGTIVAVVRSTAATSDRTIVAPASTQGIGLMTDSSGSVSFIAQGLSNGSAAVTLSNSDGWALIAASKATGSAPPRSHKYVYSTDTWQHVDAAANLGDSSGSTTAYYIGQYGPTGTYAQFAGDIAAIAVFRNRVLTDDQIESLPFSLNAWLSQAPTAMWVLDQSATTQALRDLTGGGANQSAITGTTVSTDSVPLLSYGHPVIQVARLTPPSAPYFRPGTGATALGTAGTSTLTIPTGVQVDDVMVMSVVFKVATATDTIQTPTGWTVDVSPMDGTGAGYQVARFIKTAVSGDIGAAVTVRGVIPSAQQINVAFAAYGNADPTPRVTALADNGSTASASVSAVSATTSTNDLVVYTGGVRSSASGPAGQPTFTGPGFLRAQSTGTSGGSQNVAAFLGDNGGAAGSRTVTASQSVWSVAGQIVLKAAGGAASTTANAGVADVAADASNPSTVADAVAAADVADVTAAGQTPTAVTAASAVADAGSAQVGADAYTAAPATVCTVNTGSADVTADAYTGSPSGSGTQQPADAGVAADAYPATAVTAATATADAGVAQVNAAGNNAAGVVPHLFTTQTPTGTDNSDGTPGITTATSVQTTIDGYITGVRFYATTTVSGTYTAALWQVTSGDQPGPGAGTLLASKALPGSPIGGGWNIITFDTPVAVTAGALYRAGVHNSDGRYVNTATFFQNPLVNGQLVAEAHGQDPAGLGAINQGVYEINSSLTYPDDTFNTNSYFVDVAFTLTPPSTATATAGTAAVSVDGYTPAPALAGSAPAGQAAAATDGYSPAGVVTTAAGAASVGADANSPSVVAAATGVAGNADVGVDAFNPTPSTSSSATAPAGLAQADADSLPGTVQVAQAAGLGAVAADGFNPAVVTVPTLVADSGSADVTAAALPAGPTVGQPAGAGVAQADAYNPAAVTLAEGAGSPPAATVGVDAYPATAQPTLVAAAGPADVAADAHSPAAVTQAATVAAAGVADVTTAGHTAAPLAVVIAAPGTGSVEVDAFTADAVTEASATVQALTAQADTQAFNALAILGVATGTADVAAEAFPVPRKRTPGILQTGTRRATLTAGTVRSTLAAGTTRGPG